jgi:glutathionylspermidine synthase
MSDPYEDATRELTAKLITETHLLRQMLQAVGWERDELAATVMRQDVDLLDAGGQLQDQDDEIAALKRELARWEDAADTLGPIGRPVDD